MKNNYRLILTAILIIFISVTFRSFAQIPNAGFENWTNGVPDSWGTDNNSLLSPITRTTDNHSGSYALEGSVVSYSGINITPAVNISFAYNGKPEALTGYYKFTTSNNDSLIISVVLYKNGAGMAGGSFSTATSAASYTQFTTNLYYVDTQFTPDSCAIAVVIYPAVGAQSTTQFKLDDLSFSNSATAVNTAANQGPESFKLYNNYPNPFNPSTTINYQLPQSSFVTLKVYNVLGREVATLVNEVKSAGTYSLNFNAAQLPSGVYYCAMQAGSYYKVNKMILLK